MTAERFKPWTFAGIEFDAEGQYPSEESLAALVEQPFNFNDAARFVVEHLPKANIYQGDGWRGVSVERARDSYTKQPMVRVVYATGGWSGNESVIEAALERADVSFFLVEWRRGGQFVFEIPDAFRYVAAEAGSDA